jgi:hypothetical protein
MLHHLVDLDEGIGSLQRGLEVGFGWGLCLKDLKEKDPDSGRERSPPDQSARAVSK